MFKYANELIGGKEKELRSIYLIQLSVQYYYMSTSIVSWEEENAIIILENKINRKSILSVF